MSVSQLRTLLACAVNSVAILICALAAAPVAAQTQPSQTRDAPPAAVAPTPNASPSPAVNAADNPDLSITANITARELLFEVVPTPKVEFPGRPRRDTVWEAERTNLPPQVQPGVTYRDLGIRLKITSVFADIERIVAEALGETPASDDAPPTINSNENAQPPAANAPTTTTTTTKDTAQPDDSSPSTLSTQTPPASSSAEARRARKNRVGSAQARRERP